MKLTALEKATTAKALAEETKDAYSFNRYKNWEHTALTLLKKGYNKAEAEAILRSKWMRWAADSHSAKYGSAPAKAIVTFLESMSLSERKKEVAKLVAGTFA